MEQRGLYERVKKWLESQGFQVLVTGGDEQQLIIPIGDILPTRVLMVPDIVGVKEDDRRAVIVEVSITTVYRPPVTTNIGPPK